MEICNIYLLDDHQIFSDGLRRTIESQEEYTVPRTFSRANDLLEALKIEQPDILVSDISMPGMNGLDLVKQVKKEYPTILVLMLSMHNAAAWVRSALDAGANGYLLKDSKAEDIFEALQTIRKGKSYISPSISSSIIETGKDGSEFTQREVEILREISKGATSAEIAAMFFLATSTVESHRRHMMLKARCKNMPELIAWGFKEGIL